MEYRLNKQTLLDLLEQWNMFIKRRVHLIACGGTALTLLGVKPSTKDVDFLVPIVAEYKYLINILKDLGYQQATGSGWQRKEDKYIFDLFPGKRIHTTELIDSPLDEEKHIFLKSFSNLYIGILNEYDLITSKLFRGTVVDYEDCLMLVMFRKDKIDIERLKQHYRKLSQYDISEKRIAGNLDYFLELLEREKLDG